MELRRAGIRDTRVLGAMEAIPREAFVPTHLADVAYENLALPLGGGESLSPPFVVAAMVEGATLAPAMKVLEVGTGSGYRTAVLARLVRRVFTIERVRATLQAAEARFARLRLANVVTRLGDGSRGWPEQAPFDRILVGAACARPPEALTAQLAEDGVMVVPLGAPDQEQRLVRLRRCGATWREEVLVAVRLGPLIVGRAGR